jgi:predicted lipoprotein with Yx(FWY)xxD motif
LNSKRFLTMTAALIAVGGLVLSSCSSTSTTAAAPPATSGAAQPGAASSAPAVAPASSAPAIAPASSAPAPSAPVSSAPVSIAAAAADDLKVASTKLGNVIVDGKGMTVYYFTPDKAGSGKSACSGQCLTAWPAVVPAAAAPVATGVAAKLGSITRVDGTRQVTVEGRPVYTFAFDKAPGDVTGQGDKGVWYVISPSGAQIGGAAVKTSAPASAATDLKVASTKLGKVIVDGKGMTVYYFTPDKAGSGKSACSGQCLTAWPAVVPKAATPTATGVAAKLGSITRVDGTRQATVDGRPVYTFAFDKAPGDVTGQGDKGVWYVISPSGVQIGG